MAKFNHGDTARGLIRRGKALLGASTALLAACAADAGGEGDLYLGETEQAICKTYPFCGPSIPDDPEVDPDPNPPPPPVVTSTPDVALQVSPCLDGLEMQIMSAVRTALPTAQDVRVACASGTARIGAWFRNVSGTDDAAARLRGLTSLNILKTGEEFAGYVNSRYINQNVAQTWATTPKNRNGDGSANLSGSGPIHLTSLNVRYVPSSQVVSNVGGYDERPWPDVGFTLTTTDTLSTEAGRIKCNSVSSVTTHEGWLNTLTAVLGIVVPPLGVYLVLADAFPSASDSHTNAGSVGCPAAKVFPAEIPLPLGIKAVISYSRAEVGYNGITAGGVYDLVLRTPSVAILGSRSLTAAPGDPYSYAAYAARPKDMRGVLRYQWTSTGSVATPTSSGTSISFSLANRNQVGQVKNDTVSVNVTDEDGLTASSLVSVRTTIKVPVEDSPVCQNRPWLPQCNPI